MKVDDRSLRDLRNQVRAAHEEFDVAMECHEAWKPATYDKALHERMSYTYAGKTFIVVRLALRREMLLALMRLWDTNKRSVNLRSIAKALGEPRILDMLATERGDIPEAISNEITRERREYLQKWTTKAREIIHKYDRNGSHHATLKYLKTLRDQHLAHRQIVNDISKVRGKNATDEEIETFYQDMATLISLLFRCVERTAYDPNDAAEIFRFYAKFFWDGVRGEQTKGHPNYRPPRIAVS
jgi:hypothetical protein